MPSGRMSAIAASVGVCPRASRCVVRLPARMSSRAMLSDAA